MNENYRIEQIQKATLAGVKVKVFNAYEKQGDAFVFVGQFSAPQRTANRELWKIAAAR